MICIVNKLIITFALAFCTTLPYSSSISPIEVRSWQKTVEQISPQNANYDGNSFVECEIPNQSVSGVCLPISACRPYQKIRNFNSVTPEQVNFIKRIQCRSEMKETKVCCPIDNTDYAHPEIPFLPFLREGNFQIPLLQSNREARVGKPKMRSPKFVQEKEQCGKQVTNRIYGGEIAELDDFPWMALLVYNAKVQSTRGRYGCGAALINRRFVLTAAHCVTGKTFQQLGGLRSVRLGEYNVNTDIDCIQEINHLDCADAALDIPIDKIFVHPEYDASSSENRNDIALIKLKRTVQYTHFIMPICLPGPSDDLVAPGSYLSVAGWGRTNLFDQYKKNIPSPIKLKLQVPIVSREKCLEILQPFNISLAPKQICAGGEYMKDTCLGDSGGPLMHFDRETLQWSVYGIVSFGFTQCGVEGHPGIYTHVRDYVDWIEETMKNS